MRLELKFGQWLLIVQQSPKGLGGLGFALRCPPTLKGHSMAKINKAKMACNKPKRQISGGKKFVVKACQGGKEKIIRFGDANMKLKESARSQKELSC